MAKSGSAVTGALQGGAETWCKWLLTGAALCCLVPLPASAAGPGSGQAALAKAHTSKRKLLLCSKDPVTWKVLTGKASGELLYREQTGAFSFAAVKLAPLTSYALVRYAGYAREADLLAEGKTDREGALQLAGTWSQWSEKIWLVLRADLARSGTRVTATAWHPELYLFEAKELGIPCACAEGP